MRIWIVPIIIVFLLLGVFIRSGETIAEAHPKNTSEQIENYKSAPLGLIYP
jgi:hypothetical protein